MRESTIERWFAREVKKRGGLCFKFVSPGNAGVPDRIVITPDGRVVFAELKTQTGRLSKIQAWQRAEMIKRHADVRVIIGAEDAKAFIEEVF